MQHLVIYSANSSPRLSYVLQWVFGERMQVQYSLATDETGGMPPGCHIAYGSLIPGCICIPDTGFVSHCTDEPTATATGEWATIPMIFAAGDGKYTLPFDFFSAVFYLLSRYEEYMPYTPDKHGRYPATDSILVQNDWLERPLVDEWIYALRMLLQKELGWHIAPSAYNFRPTYDIDMAYSHAYKGVGRIAGAYLRAIIKGDLEQISERTQVLKNKQRDPYDSFAWLKHLHEQYGFYPIYFILCSLKTTAFDKNIHPEHPAMKRIIRQLAREGDTGIHPSYFAIRNDIATAEKTTLEHITGNTITLSRQHYIRVKTPDTYYMLLAQRISHDYSMGYGTHMGFRAGTGASFLWYDLLNEGTSPLRIHPFCFMDTTAHYEQQLTPTEAFARLGRMTDILRYTGSNLVTIFHNFSLGTALEWKGWSEQYAAFLHEQYSIK